MNGLHFTTYVTPTTLVYSLKVAIPNSTVYLWPGLQSIGDATQVFYRFQQKTIMQGIFVNARIAAGVGNSFTVTILKSTTGVPGSGVPTEMTVTLSGATMSAGNFFTSVDFAQYEHIAVQLSSSAPGASQDLVVELDLL